ncbi:MAG: phage head-tail connector protein [Clostridia bacterium]|nr:phage head-tail connector protein [Clostridia bacterium]MBO7151001.1 phage head-tail connector protein [Clostridia bacterium]
MLENLKLMLDVPADNTDLDAKLRLIVANATARLKRLLGGIDPPEELDYIVFEVSLMRFNRIGSEGLSNHSVEGVSLTFSDRDFEGFSADIQAWIDGQKESTRGKVRFI